MAASDLGLGRLGDILSASLDLVLGVADNIDRLVNDVREDARNVAREAEAFAEATRLGAGRVSDALRATPRFARVVHEGVGLLARRRLLDARRELLGDDDADAALERFHADTAQRLHDLCVELRGGVLKLGQFASSRVDLLPPPYVEALGRLQDRVPPVSAEAILTRIDDELGPVSERFACFDETPLAAASLAQVHAATLPDGRRVVVKVQVPGVAADVRSDLAALRVLAPLLGSLVPGVDFDTVAGELSRSVSRELDYELEAAAAENFAACFAADPELIVPGVLRGWCSPRVLVLDRIDGVRIVDFLDDCEARARAGDPAGADDRDRLLTTLIRSFCDQVLVHGLLHADPHPGNFLVLPGEGGPKLAILDFGSVQHYTRERRRAWAQLGFAIVSGDQAKLAGLFAEIGFESRGGDASLRAFAELLLEHFRPGARFAEAFDAQERFESVLALLRENPIVRIPEDFVQLGRIFAALGGLLLRYQPRLDLFGILAPRLAGAIDG
jgi:ubiquinone biosynthesis protein